MKLFFFKILTFTLLIICILFSLKKTVPYYWGNKNIHNKIVYLSNNPNKHNVLFFGSSKTHRHINPIIFDSITGKNSFNMGYGGFFALENNFIIENLFKKNKIAEETHIIQQRLIPSIISKQNLHSIQSKYYLDFKRYIVALKYYSSINNFEQVYNYTISYIENLLCIGEIRAIIQYRKTEKSIYSKKLSKPSNKFKALHKGYYPLDVDSTFSKREDLRKRSRELALKSNFNKNLSKEISIINDTITNFKFNNVKFFQVNELKLDKHLYFDRGHYNSKGAAIYTMKIAEEYNDFINKFN